MKEITEKRSFSRETIDQPLKFEMSDRRTGRFGKVLISGCGIDMGDGGIGLITDCPLEAGDVLKVLVPAAMVKINLPVYVEVMWSAPAGGKRRAGLRFLA